MQEETFGVAIDPQSNFSLSVSYEAQVALSGGYVNPGDHILGTVGVSVPSTATFEITFLGTTVPLSVKPIGLLYDIPIPGLSYDFAGLAELGLYLNLSGVILGNSSVTGPCTGGGGLLSWESSSTDSFYINVSSTAEVGQSIVSTLDPIQYGLSIGVDAIGEVLGLGNITIPILTFAQLGVFNATPSSMSSSYDVGSPPKGASSPLGATAELAVILGTGAAIAILASIALVLRGRRKPPTASFTGQPTAPPSSPPR